MTHVAVIDVGKTNAKVALVDGTSLGEIDSRRRANTVRLGPPYPHYDIDALWHFILDALGDLHAAHRVDAISVTAHGASIVLLDRAGDLATPVLDYEFTGPDDLAQDYDALRPPFADTGSPRLPQGLNAGAQLHWLLETQAGLRDRLATIVTYPQFWSGRLTGVRRVEPTSLGCHTDLWCPARRDFSTLPARLGIADRFAPLGRADECLGPVLPDIARQTGLDPGTPVFSGLHDSNASLLPHLRSQAAPFSVVSTGTWVISMAIGGRAMALDPARDTLINVNADGDPTPSARFMGGREFERMRRDEAPPDDADRQETLARRLFLLPSIQHGSGPFPDRSGGWNHDAATDGARNLALHWYLALMTAECLALIGAEGATLVEGHLATNTDVLDMLAAATGRPVFSSKDATGTSAGAALLAAPEARPPAPVRHTPVAPLSDLARYAEDWRAALG